MKINLPTFFIIAISLSSCSMTTKIDKQHNSLNAQASGENAKATVFGNVEGNVDIKSETTIETGGGAVYLTNPWVIGAIAVGAAILINSSGDNTSTTGVSGTSN